MGLCHVSYKETVLRIRWKRWLAIVLAAATVLLAGAWLFFIQWDNGTPEPGVLLFRADGSGVFITLVEALMIILEWVFGVVWKVALAVIVAFAVIRILRVLMTANPRPEL